MNIRINGEDRSVESGVSLERLLLQINICPERVVVEHNRKILSSADWGGICLNEGDTLEVVSFVGGG